MASHAQGTRQTSTRNTAERTVKNDTCQHVDTDLLGNMKFELVKTIGDMFYVVTIQRGKKKLEVKTMWKKPGASC